MFTTSNHLTRENFTLCLVLAGLTAFTASALAGPRVQNRSAHPKRAPKRGGRNEPEARPIIIVTPPTQNPQPVQGPM